MNRTYKTALIVFLPLLAWLTFLEANKPAPVNWNPSYASEDKIPLGSYVLFHNLKKQEFPVEKVKIPPYRMLLEDSPEGTYFFLNNQLSFDDATLEKLLIWTSAGNTAFLAAAGFSENLLDTLGLEINTAVPREGISSKPIFNLMDNNLKGEKPYLFDHETFHSFFSGTDTLDLEVLGLSSLYSDTLIMVDPEPNFLRIPFGKGSIFLHSDPQAFSNFFLLDGENYQYAERALAYLPKDQTFYWDSYLKSGKTYQTSPLYVIFGNPSLRWAYYFLILGSILFILFEGKRKQRSIPVIPPLKNQTVEFTRTIAGLYLERKEYRSITVKKINLFLEFIRGEYRIATGEPGEIFYRDLAGASGNPESEVRELFSLIRELETSHQVSREDLLKLNSAIITFKNKTNGKQRN